MKSTFLILIFGKVQEVFFRKFIRDKIQKYKISGWAENQADGSLKIILKGEKEKLYRFLPCILEGSKLAQVKKVIIEPKNVGG